MKLLPEHQDAQLPKYTTPRELNAYHAHKTLLPLLTTPDVSALAMDHSISFNQMDHSSHAAMVTSQMLPGPVALREEMLLFKLEHVPEKERSTLRQELNVSSVCHTPEHREATPFVSQTNVVSTKSSLGSELALTAEMDLDQMPTEEAALELPLLD